MAASGGGQSLSNQRAQQLYTRLGYQGWGHGAYPLTWNAYDTAGRATPVTETCTVYHKLLIHH
ncbi:MAG: hypothetical protein R3E79_39300 [Caldilineaceae bacterium]